MMHNQGWVQHCIRLSSNLPKSIVISSGKKSPTPQLFLNIKKKKKKKKWAEGEGEAGMVGL